MFERIREIVFIISVSLGTGIFWSFLISGMVRYAFGVDENKVLLYLGFPIFFVYFFWCCSALNKILRKARGG